MSDQTKIYELLYCLSRAHNLVGELTPSQMSEVKRLFSPEDRKDQKYIAILGQLHCVLDGEGNEGGDLAYVERHGRRRQSESFEDFSLPKVMQKVRSLVLHKTNFKGICEIEWLLRILLVSPKLFHSTRELENFLTNITGMAHTTKSTGRDRIVDWFFRQLRLFPQEYRDRVVMEIARHIFISLPSNYSEWHALLYEDSD